MQKSQLQFSLLFLISVSGVIQTNTMNISQKLMFKIWENMLERHLSSNFERQKTVQPHEDELEDAKEAEVQMEDDKVEDAQEVKNITKSDKNRMDRVLKMWQCLIVHGRFNVSRNQCL